MLFAVREQSREDSHYTWLGGVHAADHFEAMRKARAKWPWVDCPDVRAWGVPAPDPEPRRRQVRFECGRANWDDTRLIAKSRKTNAALAPEKGKVV